MEESNIDQNKDVIMEIKFLKEIFYRSYNHELTNVIEKVKQIPKVLEYLYHSEERIQVNILN
jgi:hypothetical protein